MKPVLRLAKAMQILSEWATSFELVPVPKTFPFNGAPDFSSTAYLSVEVDRPVECETSRIILRECGFVEECEGQFWVYHPDRQTRYCASEGD